MSKEINELNFPGDVKYTKDHEYALLEGDTVKVGLDDYAQDQLGDIVFVEMPEIGDTFKQGDVFATVESVKAVSECYMPVGGEITAINEELEDEPELVNSDPYGKGWLVEIKPGDVAEMDTLMTSEACLASLKAE